MATGKERIMEFIDILPDGLSSAEIVICIFNRFISKQDTQTISDIILGISSSLAASIRESGQDRKAIHERATYLKMYLNGEMYTDDKPEYKAVQANNADEIIKIVSGGKERLL